MTSFMLALSVILGSPLASLQQDGWSETTFDRVYLRNGNFIDGRVMENKPNEVLLQLKVGEMGIRRDQIDRVERLKLKSWNDKAIVFDTPKGQVTPKSTDPTTTTPPPTVDTPEAIRKRVDMIMFKFKNS